MKQPIKAISNVIELKPGKKYLLVFKAKEPEAYMDQAHRFVEMLQTRGITGFGIVLKKGDEIEVIEAA